MVKYMIGARIILDTENNAVIPKDQGNTDYKEFIEWVAAGNTPDPLPDDLKFLYE